MNDKITNEAKAELFLKNLAKEQNAKFYEIVEDSYEYDNGLLLIIYTDSEHKQEISHYCVNVENF